MTNGDVIYADISKLLAAARHDLPTLAQQFNSLKGFVDDVPADGDRAAFVLCPQPTVGGYGPDSAGEAFGPWSDLWPK